MEAGRDMGRPCCRRRGVSLARFDVARMSPAKMPSSSACRMVSGSWSATERASTPMRAVCSVTGTHRRVYPLAVTAEVLPVKNVRPAGVSVTGSGAWPSLTGSSISREKSAMYTTGFQAGVQAAASSRSTCSEACPARASSALA